MVTLHCDLGLLGCQHGGWYLFIWGNSNGQSVACLLYQAGTHVFIYNLLRRIPDAV
jgi:S-ribosylhomocysteine lyase LuxS involved in autoinducer biosynthesis